MTLILIALGTAACVWAIDRCNEFPTPNAAPAPDASTPPVPERATTPCSDAHPHEVRLSEMGTWWVCTNDGCAEIWPADELHHVDDDDLPYDQEADELVDEAEDYLRRVS
jgi:hypothetical protein